MNAIYTIYNLIKDIYNNKFETIITILIIIAVVVIGLYVTTSVITAQTANLTLNTTILEVR